MRYPVLCGAFLMCVVSAASGLRCNHCVDLANSDCADGIPSSFVMGECAEAPTAYSQFFHFNITTAFESYAAQPSCMEYVYEALDRTIVTRQCGPPFEGDVCGAMMQDVPQITHCSACTEDLCNYGPL